MMTTRIVDGAGGEWIKAQRAGSGQGAWSPGEMMKNKANGAWGLLSDRNAAAELPRQTAYEITRWLGKRF